MTTYRLSPVPVEQLFAQGSDGVWGPASGALIYTYASGSSTPIFTYANATGTQNANPIVADANGRFVAYLPIDVAYKYVVTQADGTPMFERDPITVGQTVMSGTMAPAYTAKSGTYTAVANDFVSCVSGTFTVTLPLASSNANVVIWVVNNGTGTITIGHSGSDTVGGASTQTLNPSTIAPAQGDEMTFVSDGISNWNIT